MKFHPIQTNKESLDKLSEIFQASMEKRGILPKNPWKAKRLADWLAKMGGRFHPGSHYVRTYKVDAANFVNFMVDCPQPRSSARRGGWGPPCINGRREPRFVHVEIPWDVADKALMLGFVP